MDASAHMLEFKAMLCPVVTESISDIARVTSIFSQKHYSKDEAAYISRSKETNKYLKQQHRNITYLTVISYRFVEKFPFIKEVDVLEMSSFDKLIVIMTVFGLSAKEISGFLMTDIRSVNSIRYRRKDVIEAFHESS